MQNCDMLLIGSRRRDDMGRYQVFTRDASAAAVCFEMSSSAHGDGWRQTVLEIHTRATSILFIGYHVQR